MDFEVCNDGGRRIFFRRRKNLGHRLLQLSNLRGQSAAGAFVVGDGCDLLQRVLNRLVEIEFALQGIALRDQRLSRFAVGLGDLFIQSGDLRLDVGDALRGVG